jgi:hypothetical protein
MNTKSILQELRARPDAARTLALLKILSAEYLAPKHLIAYHEHLLFYKAYCPSKAVRNFCEDELLRFAERVEALDEDLRSKLDLSGIVGSNYTYAYELPNAKWLMSKIGKGIEIDWDLLEQNGNELLEGMLPVIMEASEGDAVDSPTVSIKDYFQAASGKYSSLQWL